jgi:hypothetical protein
LFNSAINLNFKTGHKKHRKNEKSIGEVLPFSCLTVKVKFKMDEEAHHSLRRFFSLAPDGGRLGLLGSGFDRRLRRDQPFGKVRRSGVVRVGRLTNVRVDEHGLVDKNSVCGIALVKFKSC